ncbi:F0F1 ATP synthase subunit delta [Corynebacterium kutscheri]|uniref:ATP synthase subunit delta n=1 Tax=Corynebacterium kutscheri TaxID=35755 RepID=A0AB38VYP1_9CORY|nr:F0F1 ATP synthase subunit delta [Corynebacterium kutscheri]VEH08916.1 ATP synthase subunit delta [Corynebacterium kutscheri]
MHAASRDALAFVISQLDSILWENESGVAVASQVGAELFDVVEVLDNERTLRIAIADTSNSADQRVDLVSAVFTGKVSQSTLELLLAAARQEWSTPREFRTGLVKLGRHALLRSAERQGQLKKVEDELFGLSRVLLKQSELTLLLDDRSTNATRKRELLAQVLYGKVTAVTEALALQVIGRRENNAIDDMLNLAKEVAALQGRDIAYVVSAAPLSDTQSQALATKLERIYGREINIHSEVEPSLLGGMVIRVGNEVIDGSTLGKLEKLRTQFV